VVLTGAATAEGAFTTPKCLAAKIKVWGKLRQCQRAVDAKRTLGKLADATKCTTSFQSALAKLDARAAKAVVPCRVRDNADGTVTDLVSGLMWEKETDDALFCVLGIVTCWTLTFTWSEAMVDFLIDINGLADDSGKQLGFAGHSDWRLPSVAELQTTEVEPFPCGVFPCIDPAFGPTIVGQYWSSSSDGSLPGNAWFLDYNFASIGIEAKIVAHHVRAVRNGL
jgi:uncharacterized protein DUF1566